MSGSLNILMLVSTTSITVLLVLVLLLCVSTRFKGESTFAALIILLTTIPEYVYALSRIYGWIDISLISAPLAYSSNLALMPLMYLLAHKGFNPYYKFRPVYLLHFIPAAAFAFVVVFGLKELSASDLNSYTMENTAQYTRKQTSLNFIILTVQLIVYFTVIFRYLKKVRIYIFNHYSTAEIQSKRWIPRLITLIGVLVIFSMILYNIWDYAIFYFFYLTNIIAMGYLIYNKLEDAFQAKNSGLQLSEQLIHQAQLEFENEQHKTEALPLNTELPLLQQYAQTVEQWLHNSGAYINPNLSINEVSKATGISANNISKSINTILEKNFFDLINGYRIEKSKQLLKEKKERGLTLETIAEQCGFNSQHTYCRAFKQQTGLTTTQWLKSGN